MTDDDDALHAARIVSSPRRLNVTTDDLFAQIADDPQVPARDRYKARRVLDALQIGRAVEATKDIIPGEERAVLVRLARAIRPHLATRRPGWFRFILELGSQPGESMFQLSYMRRPKSKKAQPEALIKRATRTRKAVSDNFIAGAILRRIEVATASGVSMTLLAAIEAAINAGEIKTDEEAARQAFQRFRRSCEQLTGGRDTYRLEQYAGPISKFQGSWVAVPDTGIKLSRLPSEKGGRPKT